MSGPPLLFALFFLSDIMQAKVTLLSTPISFHLKKEDLKHISDMLDAMGFHRDSASFAPREFVGGPQSGKSRHRMRVEDNKVILTIGRYRGVLSVEGYYASSVMERYNRTFALLGNQEDPSESKPKLGEVGLMKNPDRLKELFTDLWEHRDTSTDTFTKAAFLSVVDGRYQADNKVAGIIFGHLVKQGMLVEMGEENGEMQYTLGASSQAMLDQGLVKPETPEPEITPVLVKHVEPEPPTPLHEAMTMIKEYPAMKARVAEITRIIEELRVEKSSISEKLAVLEPAVKALEALTGKPIL